MDLTCPACTGQRLHEKQWEGLPASACPQCGGLWVSLETFAALRKTAAAAGSTVESGAAPRFARPPLKEESPPARRYRPCPACRDLMVPSNFQYCGVIIDRCRQHGIWFDDEELQRILQWIREGGLRNAVAQQHEQDKQTAQASAEQSLAIQRLTDGDLDELSDPNVLSRRLLFGFLSWFGDR